MSVRRGSAAPVDRRGFTLVELLVAVAVLGILLSVIASLTSGFLGFSRQVSVINDRLADLNDTMGYVSLTARSAMRVYGEPGSTRSISFDGDPAFTCAVDDAVRPCIAFVVPTVDRISGAITGFEFVAYAVRPLSDWAARNPGIPAGWAGDATPVLLEYRASLCTGCTTPPAVSDASAVIATTESLVIANLFLRTDAPDAQFAPFVVENTRITISLRTRGSGTTDGVRVPRDGALTQLVIQRP